MTHVSRHRDPATALVLAALLVACGTQTTSPTAAPPSVEPSASESAAPSRTPRPSPTPEPPSAFAGAWVDVTADTIGETADYTNMVELADINGDGLIDILFANGGGYELAEDPVQSRVFLAGADGSWVDATESVLGDLPLITRVIKVGDLNADGAPDILLATTYNTQSRLMLGDGSGAFTDVTETHLPAADLSVGDVELGDVDADGDLDLALIDWGDPGPAVGAGLVHLWLNDGAATFTDATAERMPPTLTRFSWDLELVDVDNDWDLDVAISSKLDPGSHLYENDGAGVFTDVTDGRMPAFTNNYEFAPIDLDRDGFLDLVTINDGDATALGLSERVLRNDGSGAFVDMTAEWWPRESNLGYDDNGVYAVDVDSDGDADFLVGSLDGPDRLLINDGDGRLTVATDVFDTERPSRGSLGFALADLNGDGRLDVVEAQGEVPGHHDERVYLGTEVLAPDSAKPIVRSEVVGSSVVARVHDNRTPNKPLDWQSVVARWDGGEAPMTWYGENLFRSAVPDGASGVTVCAVDAAGNEACSSAGDS